MKIPKTFLGNLHTDFKGSIEWLVKIFGENEFVICGSVGLIINGKIKRSPHDIDIITIKDWFNPNVRNLPGVSRQFGQSDKFYIGNTLVKCFSILSPYGIHIDVMHRKEALEYEKHYLSKDLLVKVQNPEQAIEVKRSYLEVVKTRSSSKSPNPESIKKHSEDISYYEDDLPF